MNNKIKIPLNLAWEIMAILRGIVNKENYKDFHSTHTDTTTGERVSNEFSKLLEPYRKEEGK